MDRETFAQRLHQASVVARDSARRSVLEAIPDEMLFRVRSYQSYDFNRLVFKYRFYPDDILLKLTGKLLRCTEEEVVNVLWRQGRVPQWVDMKVCAETGSATIMLVRCSEPFTDDERLLYHAKEGWSPFRLLGMTRPPGDLRGGKFSIYAHCEVLNFAEIQDLEPHRDAVQFLDLLGPECDDSTLETLPEFPAMRVLQLIGTATTGFGLASLDRHSKLRKLNIFVQPGQEFDLDIFLRLPFLSTLTVSQTSCLSLDLGRRSPNLPNLDHLSLRSEGVLKLDGRLPISMGVLILFGQSLKGKLTCCEQVQCLGLHFAQGSENEIRSFVRNTNGVKFLDLSFTPVSEALVTDLVNRWPLVSLDISFTKVSEEFAAQLAQLHPGLRVVHRKGAINGARVAPPSESLGAGPL